MDDDLKSQEPDSYLVKQAKSGDGDAFGALYERYATDIYRFLHAQLPEFWTAEDLTSDVFLRAWNFLPRYKDRGYTFSAFLYKIARNVLIDYRRKTRYETNRVPIDPDNTTIEKTELSEQLIRIQEHQTLWRILNSLRDDYRSILVLRFINGVSIQDISRIMGRSEGAIRILQHRALKALRQILLSSNDKHEHNQKIEKFSKRKLEQED